MPLLQVRYPSQALQKACSMHIILPEKESSNGLYPVCYLLGGLGDDDSIWERRTRIEWYVRELPLIVVMPHGDRGFYTDWVEGPAHERHIIQDVIGFVERFLPVRKERQGRVIGGLSMGGYGALKLGLKYPQLFGSIAAHSSACHVGHAYPPQMPEERRNLLLPIFGPHPEGSDNDLFALAERIDRSLLPAIRFDCGVDDGLLEGNRAFHRHLERLDIPHEYAEYPGAHTWDYWDVHVQEAIAFHWRTCGAGI